MGRVDLCCSCGKELEDVSEHFHTRFRYKIPGDSAPEQVLVAIVCDKCAKDSDDPALFPVIEMLILARVIRIEHPDRLFTPETRKDE